MNRRNFLRSIGVVSAGLALPKGGRLFAKVTEPAAWRKFEVTTRIEVLKPSGTTRIWMPTALTSPTPFQETFSNTFNAEGGTAKMVESKPDALGIIASEFPAGVKPILGHEPDCDQKLHGRSVQTRQGVERDKSGLGAFSAADQILAHGRHCEGDVHRDHKRCEDGC